MYSVFHVDDCSVNKMVAGVCHFFCKEEMPQYCHKPDVHFQLPGSEMDTKMFDFFSKKKLHIN